MLWPLAGACATTTPQSPQRGGRPPPHTPHRWARRSTHHIKHPIKPRPNRRPDMTSLVQASKQSGASLEHSQQPSEQQQQHQSQHHPDSPRSAEMLRETRVGFSSSFSSSSRWSLTASAPAPPPWGDPAAAGTTSGTRRPSLVSPWWPFWSEHRRHGEARRRGRTHCSSTSSKHLLSAFSSVSWVCYSFTRSSINEWDALRWNAYLRFAAALTNPTRKWTCDSFAASGADAMALGQSATVWLWLTREEANERVVDGGGAGHGFTQIHRVIMEPLASFHLHIITNSIFLLHGFSHGQLFNVTI